jgi:hypothetical protein
LVEHWTGKPCKVTAGLQNIADHGTSQKIFEVGTKKWRVKKS